MAKRSLKKNTVINLLGYVAPMTVSLITVPLYLHVVGAARYGALAIVWILLDYFGVFDFGLGRATTNELAKRRDRPPDEKAEVFWTSLSTNTVLGLIGGACLFGIGYALFTRGIATSGTLRHELKSSLPLVAAAVPLATLSSVLVGSLESEEEFGLVNVVGVASMVASQILPLTVATVAGPSLPVLVGTSVGIGLITTVGLFGVCLRVVPLGRRLSTDPKLRRRLLRYGGWITVTNAVGPVLTTVDRIVVGAMSGAVAVTHYTIPANLATRCDVLARSVARTIFPRLSVLQHDEARDVADDAAVALLIVMTPIVVGALTVMEPVLRIWVGADIANVGAPVGEIILIGIWINSLAYVPLSFLQARGRPDVPAKLHVLELPPYLFALWAGLTLAGIRGAAVAWTSRVAVDMALLYSFARVSLHEWRRLAVAGVIVFLTLLASLTVFADPLWRISLGGALVASACAWSFHQAFRRFGPSIRRTPRIATPAGSTT